MTVFETAIDDLFADPNLARDAVWHAGGTGAPIAVSVIVSRPDRTFESFDRATRTATCKIEVRTSEIANAAADDRVDLDGVTYQIVGAPMRDAEHLVWTCDAAEL